MLRMLYGRMYASYASYLSNVRQVWLHGLRYADATLAQLNIHRMASMLVRLVPRYLRYNSYVNSLCYARYGTYACCRIFRMFHTLAKLATKYHGVPCAMQRPSASWFL